MRLNYLKRNAISYPAFLFPLKIFFPVFELLLATIFRHEFDLVLEELHLLLESLSESLVLLFLVRPDLLRRHFIVDLLLLFGLCDL